jgi:hypothetical protein
VTHDDLTPMANRVHTAAVALVVIALGTVYLVGFLTWRTVYPDERLVVTLAASCGPRPLGTQLLHVTVDQAGRLRGECPTLTGSKPATRR